MKTRVQAGKSRENPGCNLGERALNSMVARVHLAQVHVFANRGHIGFANTLLQWAANRRRAMAQEPMQRELL